MSYELIAFCVLFVGWIIWVCIEFEVFRAATDEEKMTDEERFEYQKKMRKFSKD